MSVPGSDHVHSTAWLSAALEASPDWPHGPVRVLGATRIGVAHGMSGRISRVVADTQQDGELSLVVKEETAEAVERELLFHSDCAELMRGFVPTCYGGVVDAATRRGVLFLEDIALAEQGDILRGGTAARVEAAVRALARLHGGSWQATADLHPERLPRWGARPLERDLWLDRLDRADARFPQVLTPELAAEIAELPVHVARSLARLRSGPAAWIQVDAHLDNVLWRPDGSAVLLDWCNAAIGPPAADLARFLSEGVDAVSRPALVSAYLDELQARVAVTAPEVTTALGLALLPLVQSAVGWAGREDLPSQGRPAEVCELWLRSVVEWASQGAFRLDD